MRWMRVPAVMAMTGTGLFALAGCGSNVDATEYNAETRSAFLAACTDSTSDPVLVRDVCECAYDEIEANVAFDDFVALEETLRLDSLASLPEDVAGYVAECFVDEVEL